MEATFFKVDLRTDHQQRGNFGLKYAQEKLSRETFSGNGLKFQLLGRGECLYRAAVKRPVEFISNMVESLWNLAKNLVQAISNTIGYVACGWKRDGKATELKNDWVNCFGSLTQVIADPITFALLELRALGGVVYPALEFKGRQVEQRLAEV